LAFRSLKFAICFGKASDVAKLKAKTYALFHVKVKDFGVDTVCLLY